MDVALVLMFPLLVLVWIVGMLHGGVVMLVGVKRRQMFHLFRVPTPEMMDGVRVLMVVDYGLVIMESKLGS
ncbi:MAG: hypothetical protein HY671_03825 [Chloroflexi bacterium]|nr:hypothetical protein [Chloroflexota bacterium]